MSGSDPERRLPAWAGPIVALLPAVLAAFHIVNRDIGFHVATGRAIELLGRVPQTNVLSFTHPNHPWVLHQWIPAWLFYRIDAWLGPAGLVALKVGVVWLTWVFVWLALRQRIRRWSTALLWFSLSVGAAFPRFYVRPYIFSFLLLAVFLWGLTRWEDPEPVRRRRFRLLTLAVGAPATIHR